MKIVAVTSCPLGMVYTYMAAEALNIAAQKRNMEIKIETQGAIGVENRLTSMDINDADAVILTRAQTAEDSERFKDKLIFRISIKEAIRNADEIVAKIVTKISAI